MSEALKVVGAIIRRGDQYLACRRRIEKADGGKWEFPGGKIEPGETPELALKRELSEELNINDVYVNELAARGTSDSSGNLIDLACYWVNTESKPLSSTDHDVLRWCSSAELRDLDWATADLPAVAAILSKHSTESKGN